MRAMRRRPLKRLRALLRRLGGDAGGGVLVPLALALPVLFGFGALVLDGGRLVNLHTSVQAGADALALAAAAELDRRPDSIARANRAVQTLVANDQRFGAGDSRIGADDFTVRYLRALPARDSDQVDVAALQAVDATQARYAFVQVNGFTLTTLVARAAGVTGPNPQVAASAIGGFDQAVCNFSPFFVCNPFEGTSTNLFDGIRDEGWRGRLFRLKGKGGGAKYFPGNYGFLEPPTGHGAKDVKEAIAIDRPPACFRQAGVELRTGNIASVAEAFNVRFDMYEGPFDKVRSDPAYRPAQSVRKGFVGACGSQTRAYDPAARPKGNEAALGMPRDNCFYQGKDGNCPNVSAAMAGRVGDGKWDCKTYWETNFPGLALPTIDGKTCKDDSKDLTRYQVYRYEIEQVLTGTRSRGRTNPAVAGETGAPICYSGDRGLMTSDPLDRRIVMAAILDCQAVGPIHGSSGGPYPVTAFVRFFLTEPMDKQDGEVWAELIDLIEPGTPGAREILRDIVQLYR